jgi:hypothetical protein
MRILLIPYGKMGIRGKWKNPMNAMVSLII